MDLTYFNPGLQDEASFRANFIARQDMLAYFLNQLRRTAPGQPARHHLIVAPRGYGKTSLLRRIGLAIKDEAELDAKFIALRFREEQHNVISLDLFWRNCLESLLESREEEGAPATEIQALEALWEQHAPRQALPREQQDGLPAWQALKAHCEILGRRPVLLMDNFDTLLAGLGEQQQWALRNILQSDEGPVLLAAAPRYPDSVHDGKAAFYDFFRVQTLNKLDNDEVLRCLRRIALNRQEAGKPVLRLLESDPGRVAALNTMAGGNPRTLNVLYSVLESHLSTDVFSQLSAMLDTFTGWYQARTEELPMQARAVFDALALNWDPMTAAALAAATGLDTSSVNSQLSRLERNGFVETVQLSRKSTGRNGYQVSERFFNIWYLMRNGPRRARHSVRFLTVFLQSCFNAQERRQLARNVLADEANAMELPLALASHERNPALRQQLLAKARYCADQTGRLQDYEEIVQYMPAKTSNKGSRLSQQLKAAFDLRNKADEFYESGDLQLTLKTLDKVISRFGEFGEPALRAPVARALVNKGYALAELGQREAALEAYDSVVARFGQAEEPVLHESVAYALFNKGVALAELGQREAALEAYDSVVARFGQAEEPVLRERVAQALFNKGNALVGLGQREAALEAYDSVVARFGQAEEPALRKPVARALANKGFVLAQRGQGDGAREAYEGSLALMPDEALLWNHLGNVYLDQCGEPDKALSSYEQGLMQDAEDGMQAFLHANCAYVLALHTGDGAALRQQVEAALQDGVSIKAAGRQLLQALLVLETDWQAVFDHLGLAVESDDSSLWSDYLDDLQRLLEYVLRQGAGDRLKTWMEARQYPLTQAPLYHALRAALEGDDHLLKINPETRQPAQQIYAGIARLIQLYAPVKASGKPKRSKK